MCYKPGEGYFRGGLGVEVEGWGREMFERRVGGRGFRWDGGIFEKRIGDEYLKGGWVRRRWRGWI